MSNTLSFLASNRPFIAIAVLSGLCSTMTPALAQDKSKVPPEPPTKLLEPITS